MSRSEKKYGLRWAKPEADRTAPELREGCPSEDVQQPEDRMQSAGAVRAAGGARRGQHRARGRGHQQSAN